MSKYYEVRSGEVKRFSSLKLEECEQFAKQAYRSEGEIPEIFEIVK